MVFWEKEYTFSFCEDDFPSSLLLLKIHSFHCIWLRGSEGEEMTSFPFIRFHFLHDIHKKSFSSHLHSPPYSLFLFLFLDIYFLPFTLLLNFPYKASSLSPGSSFPHSSFPRKTRDGKVDAWRIFSGRRREERTSFLHSLSRVSFADAAVVLLSFSLLLSLDSFENLISSLSLMTSMITRKAER